MITYPRNVHPENGSMHLAINNIDEKGGWFTPSYVNKGIVGVVVFRDNKWFSLPDMQEVPEINNFRWIDLEFSIKNPMKHCDNCICSCECRVFDIDHNDKCPCYREE